MPKGPSRAKRPDDVTGCAVRIARITSNEIEETQTAGKIPCRK